MSDHIRLDQRSLALHKAIAAKIKANPTLIDKARQNIDRWQTQSPSIAGPLNEWESILNQGIEKALAFMCDPGEEATRLRQSSPFAGILTEAERLEIFERFSAQNYYRANKP